MFTDDTVAYLEELSVNNNKPWFDSQRVRYDSLRARFLDHTGEILAATAVIDADLAGVDASKSVFRINRDIRFSADKTPYKTSFSAVLRPAKDSSMHGYYYCIDAEGSLEIGAGIHMPDAATLRKIRRTIARDGKPFDDILREPKLHTVFGDLDGEQLKTSPRDFPADHPYIHYLRYKSFTVGNSEPAVGISDSALAGHVADLFAIATPFVKYLRAAVQ